MKIKPYVQFLILFFFSILFGTTGFAQANPEGQTTLEQGFQTPPISSRPKALWPWLNGNVSLGQITYELEEASRKGMGGFDIWDIGVLVDPDKVIPAGPAFLSDHSLHAIAHTLREADRLELEIGLTFASSWNAGGSWVKPEDGAMGLFRSDTLVQGPANFSHTLPFPVIPKQYGRHTVIQHINAKTGLPEFYREVALLAHPVSGDSIIAPGKIVIFPFKDAGRKFSWKVPDGKWRIVRYVCAPTGQPLAIPSPNSRGLMLDHFSAKAQQNNLRHIFSRLLPFTGPLQNRSLKYLYADSYEVNSAVWTPLMPEAFQEKNGYPLEKLLPVLDGFQVENKETSDRFLFDFRKTLSDLIIENHYRLGRKLCEEQGIGFVAEAGGPGQPIHNVPFEDLKALGSVSIPRGEFWNKHPQLELLQVVKGIASAAHIYDQKYVEAESFTSVWLWQEGPDELKPLADRAMCEGLNRFVYHTFPHTPPESGDPGWVYNFGTLINTTNGWWPKSKGFHDYLARCSYLLQQGNFVGDVAFYYGDEAPNFTGPKRIHKGLGFGFDYDVVNTEILLSKMEVRDKRVYLPHGQSYEVLVLPSQRSINLAVLQKLEKMILDGAVVIGPKPVVSLGLRDYEQKDKEVQTLADKIWGTCDSVNVKENSYGKGKVVWGKTIRDVLLEKGVDPDIKVAENLESNLDFIHRKTNDEEIYFIRNTSAQRVHHSVTFRVKDLDPQLWNPETGDIIPVPVYKKTNESITIPLFLEVNGSVFIVFKNGKHPSWSGLTLNGNTFTSITDKGNITLFTREGIVTDRVGEWSWRKGNQTITKKTARHAPLDLNGPWVLHFDQTKGGPSRDTLQHLIPLNESEKDDIRYYSGIVTYQNSFSLNSDQIRAGKRLFLDLGAVSEIAEVYINGKNVGTAWHAPFRLDITEGVREGENTVLIEVVNTINNRLVGDARLPKDYQRTNSNVKKLPNAWMKPFAEAPLLPSGIRGPVRINFLELLSKQ